MNLYKISISIDAAIILVFLVLLMVDRNPVFGIRIPATLSDPEIWKKTHQKAAQIYCTLSLLHIILLLLSGSNYTIRILDVSFWLLFVLLFLYIIYYANTLYEDKFPQKVKKTNPFKSPFLNKLFHILRKLNPVFVKMQFWI